MLKQIRGFADTRPMPVRQRHPQGQSRRASGGDDGFTLVEVLIAMTLLMVVLIPTAVFLSDQVLATGNIRSREVGSQLASQVLETARGQSFATLQQGVNGPPTSTTQTVGTVTYTLTTTKRWQTATVDAGGCNSSGNGGSNLASSALLLVEATVTWQSMGGTAPVRADTTIAQPWTSGAPTSGSFELAVTGASGGPSVNVPVVVTDSANHAVTYQTDLNGCLFTANVVPGVYALKLSQPGWVDPNGNLSATQSLTVVAGQFTTASPMNYDSGATITVVFAGGLPPSNLPMTVANTSLIPNGTRIFTGGLTSLAPLYPYTNGYSVWAGDCPDSNPHALNKTGGSLYPAASGATNVTAGAGQTASGTVALSTLNLTVQTAGLLPVANSQVAITATTDPNAASQCTDPLYYTLAGTTSATGTISAGLPLGYFLVSALDAAGNRIGTPTTVSMQPGSITTATVVN